MKRENVMRQKTRIYHQISTQDKRMYQYDYLYLYLYFNILAQVKMKRQIFFFQIMAQSKIFAPTFFTNNKKRLMRLLTAKERNALEGIYNLAYS